MNINSLSIPLQVSAEHSARLKSLQETFANVCNALAPVVKETRCWNRVALHHMMYKTLREQFPQLGSQMVCNAIYSVSRTSRLVFQSPHSPFNIQLLADKALPLLQFLPSAPVYFDRHTLSLKAGSLSMYTLDGRMRFELNMKDEDLNRFKTMKLHEIILQNINEQFTLSFSFGEGAMSTPQADAQTREAYWPEYIVIDQAPHSMTSTLYSHASDKTASSMPTPSTQGYEVRLSSPAQVQVQLQLQQPLNTSVRSFTAAVPSRSLETATSTGTNSNSPTISILPLGVHP